ncbi:MAG: FMN-binding protein [Chloroflexi bacterium]|jgi:uncharacterized protein with FMN-binding domain|nr:FMN-binding protein [Chloroflexota bacterium]
MPRRGAIALLLTTAALALLLSFKTPTDPSPAASDDLVAGSSPAATPAAVEPVVESTPAAADATPAQDAATPAPAATPAADAAYRDGTVTGAAIGIRWGAVQVQVTIAGGVITEVAAIELPDGDRHSAQLSQRAEPQLRSSALATQGADVDIVSGATYTSLAYAQSLQAALDAARA